MIESDPLDLRPESVDAFLAKTLEDAEVAAAVAERSGGSAAATAELLGNLASEARLACRLLSTMRPRRGMRILEVGSGAGVVAAYLHGQGADLVAIEPIVGGFEAFVVARSLLAERVEVPEILPLAAEQLRPAEHGPFDLIFSVNVLEHMHPLERNLDALAAVLAPGGVMIHTCANYRVPYEPHYRIPLVPVWPGLTGKLARGKAAEPLWESLNWITAGDIQRFAARHGLTVHFRPGELATAIRRLRTDPEFARRQRGPVISVLRVLDRVGVVGLLNRAPAAWLTPMTFTVSRPTGN